MRNIVDRKNTSIEKQLLLIAGSLIAFLILLFFSGCDENNDPGPGAETPELTGNSITYNLVPIENSGVSGTVEFAETTDNNTWITFNISGGTQGEVHPVHIHQNSQVEGGGIVISLGNIDGTTGDHEILVETRDDDSAVSYNDLTSFDGHINIHASPSDLSTIVAAADIGGNELTGDEEDYGLTGKAEPGLSGEVLLQERKNGETLVTVRVEDYTGSDDLPNHIHADNAVTGGPIVVSLNPVDASTGIGMTHVGQFDDGTPVSFSDLNDFDGHVNIHKSESELQIVILQGDFGQNRLTGDEVEYELMSRTADDVSGTALFSKRENNETLVTLMLNNTLEELIHPAHIHLNSAAEGGGIAIDLTAVDGSSGMSMTNISQYNDDTPITYDELIEIDGYINVHLSGTQLSTVIAQGDVGQNALTGNSVSYDLAAVGGSNISGMVIFHERMSGSSLVEISLTGTVDPDIHPAHIHANDVSAGGGIIIGLKSVNGNSGTSLTHVEAMDDETPISYDQLTEIDGHVNVHKSMQDFSVVANGNVGQNAD
ncbi:MAG: hypothetical protein KFF73_17760 [Cyclobacteriaceae bacterium]|nr:hypothetical protein [Cyclobacteriaceae bacterium]